MTDEILNYPECTGDSTPQLLFEGEAYIIDVDDGDIWAWDFYDWDDGRRTKPA
ncbi:MAG: hypothetical protein AAGF11_43705 [Myxococcota bacterium]